MFSSGSNRFGNNTGNTHQFTGSLAVTGSLSVNGASSFSSNVTATGNLNLQGAVTRNINFYDSSNTNINAQIQYDQISSTSGQLFFGTNNAGTFATRLTISNTGAATFSGNLKIITPALGTNKLTFGVAGTDYYTLEYNDTTGNINYQSKYSHIFSGGAAGTTTILTLANTGEATFSSSVTATSGNFTVDGVATNSVLDILTLSHTTSGTAASGLGAGILFKSERPSGGVNLSRAAIYGIAGSNPDDDGDLTFYTRTDTSGAGFTEKMRIDSNGNIGIGTTSNLNLGVTGTVALSVGGSTAYGGIQIRNSTGNLEFFVGGATSTDALIRSNMNGNLRFGTNGGESLRITSGGSLQISYNPGGGDVYFRDTTNGAVMLYIIPAIYVGTAPFNTNKFLAANSSDISFETGGAERMRITNDNNVLFNTTSTSTSNTSSFIFRSGTGAYSGVMVMNHATTNNTGAGFIDCYYNTNYIGGIQQNGTSNISFSTSSDYRLKEDLKDFNGLNLISNLKVYDFKWKTENSRMYGVIAHELQEIIPYTVSGNKDEIKENGKIKVQVVDYSKLVPVLVKAIQELKAENDTLKSRIDTLEQA